MKWEHSSSELLWLLVKVFRAFNNLVIKNLIAFNIIIHLHTEHRTFLVHLHLDFSSYGAQFFDRFQWLDFVSIFLNPCKVLLIFVNQELNQKLAWLELFTPGYCAHKPVQILLSLLDCLACLLAELQRQWGNDHVWELLAQDFPQVLKVCFPPGHFPLDWHGYHFVHNVIGSEETPLFDLPVEHIDVGFQMVDRGRLCDVRLSHLPALVIFCDRRGLRDHSLVCLLVLDLAAWRKHVVRIIGIPIYHKN